MTFLDGVCGSKIRDAGAESFDRFLWLEEQLDILSELVLKVVKLSHGKATLLLHGFD